MAFSVSRDRHPPPPQNKPPPPTPTPTMCLVSEVYVSASIPSSSPRPSFLWRVYSDRLACHGSSRAVLTLHAFLLHLSNPEYAPCPVRLLVLQGYLTPFFHFSTLFFFRVKTRLGSGPSFSCALQRLPKLRSLPPQRWGYNDLHDVNEILLDSFAIFKMYPPLFFFLRALQRTLTLSLTSSVWCFSRHPFLCSTNAGRPYLAFFSNAGRRVPDRLFLFKIFSPPPAASPV